MEELRSAEDIEHLRSGYNVMRARPVVHEVFVVTLPEAYNIWTPTQVELYREQLTQSLREQGMHLPVVVIPLGATVQIVRSPQE